MANVSYDGRKDEPTTAAQIPQAHASQHTLERVVWRSVGSFPRQREETRRIALASMPSQEWVHYEVHYAMNCAPLASCCCRQWRSPERR